MHGNHLPVVSLYGSEKHISMNKTHLENRQRRAKWFWTQVCPKHENVSLKALNKSIWQEKLPCHNHLYLINQRNHLQIILLSKQSLVIIFSIRGLFRSLIPSKTDNSVVCLSKHPMGLVSILIHKNYNTVQWMSTAHVHTVLPVAWSSSKDPPWQQFIFLLP